MSLVPKLRFPEYTGEWYKQKLGHIANFSKGKGISKAEIAENGKTECIRYGELYTTYGETIDEVKSKTNIDIKDLVISEANDVIIPASGETQIDIATASCVLRAGIALGGDLNIIKTKNNGVFLSYYLNSKKKLDIAGLAQGISVVHLYSSQLALLELNLPTLPEQQKIANFLTAVDTKLQALKKKKSLLEDYKKGVMQKLFSQELRFKPALSEVEGDENGKEFPDWEVKKLGEEIIEFKENSELNNQYKVLTSSNKGLMLQSEYYGENRLTERENIGFNVIPHGFITYRSRSDNGLFTFNLNTLGYTGIISTYYPVFRFKKGDNKFLVEYLNYHKNTISKNSVGTSQRVLSFSSFNEIHFAFPIKDEQTRIANFLSSLDEKIQAVQTQIDKTETWKKGLLQKMFV